MRCRHKRTRLLGDCMEWNRRNSTLIQALIRRAAGTDACAGSPTGAAETRTCAQAAARERAKARNELTEAIRADGYKPGHARLLAQRLISDERKRAEKSK